MHLTDDKRATILSSLLQEIQLQRWLTAIEPGSLRDALEAAVRAPRPEDPWGEVTLVD